VVLIDHEDSFVHTLANYLRQTGAEVKTIRHTNLKAFLQVGFFVVILNQVGTPVCHVM
jgi:anthranilate synthase